MRFVWYSPGAFLKKTKQKYLCFACAVESFLRQIHSVNCEGSSRALKMKTYGSHFQNGIEWTFIGVCYDIGFRIFTLTAAILSKTLHAFILVESIIYVFLFLCPCLRPTLVRKANRTPNCGEVQNRFWA